MKIPSEGIADILLAKGVVSNPGQGVWPHYLGILPTGVDQAVGILDRGGPSPEVLVAIDYPSVQILVRSAKNGYVACRRKAETIFEALQAIPGGGAEFPELTSCVAVGGITFVGYDTNERPVQSLNFNLIVSKPPEGYRDL